jgi:shikimate kinase
MNIGLIGYRNSGKSTVSWQLRNSVERDVINTDQEIREFFGMEIPCIIQKYGWNMFRYVEGIVLNNCLNLNDVILDLGGGVILNKKAMDRIRKDTFLIYLDCSVETLIARAKENYYRPALTSLSLETEIAKVAQERRPVYQQYADLIIETDDLSADECEEIILNNLNERNVLKGTEKIYSGEGILCVSSF